jgi:hypothetical protein
LDVIASETGRAFLTILIDLYKAFGLKDAAAGHQADAKSAFQFERANANFECVFFFMAWH